MSRALIASASIAPLIGVAVFAAVFDHARIGVAVLAVALWLFLWSFEKLRASIEEKKS
jgi:hypothetical protein